MAEKDGGKQRRRIMRMATDPDYVRATDDWPPGWPDEYDENGMLKAEKLWDEWNTRRIDWYMEKSKRAEARQNKAALMAVILIAALIGLILYACLFMVIF